MWLFFFLFWIAVRANAKEPLYRKIGDKAVLTPDSVVNPITSIKWTHGPSIAMEWFGYGDETFCYRQFKDRGSLNTSTGALTITGLTPDDSGNYTVEINDKVTSKTQLLVISPVSKPTLSLWCEPEMTYCVLTCNGNTTGAEPVTYWWTSGDMTWSSTKEHNITKENNELWFSCAFENPVSFNSSEIVFNPFMEKEPLYGKTGDKAVLTSDSVVNPITSIAWTHGPSIAMVWHRYGDETFAHRYFKEHGRLNISTGALTITGLTPDDSGNYTVEINNKVTSKTELLVISPVSKPTLSIWCEPEMIYCVLTCNGNTTGAEPVTYWWTSGDMTWSSTKEHNITKENNELWFSCAFKNPVSSSSSEIVFNPFMEKEPLYGKTGDKAVLTPDSVMSPIYTIVWKHGPYLAIEWFRYGDETYSYLQFKDRGSLDTSTGALTITGLTPDDSGNYTVEINDEVTSKAELLVISPVSKPTLSIWCEPEMTYCVLTCNGNTTGAEPVTYNWTSGDMTWSSTKEHNITKENNELWFSCAFENPVSFISSEIVFNPFKEKEPLYGKIGDKAVLTSDSVMSPIYIIVWKHGPYLAMEWYGDETTAYRQFKDRGSLNTSTGALTITGLTPDDSGSYTVEINNKVTSKTEFLVISPVSKPTLSLWCEPEMTYCVLTCNGDTTGAEPVTYWWTSGDTTWSSTKEHKITKENKEPWFSCAFENPVSFISSEKVFNPFMEKKTLYGKTGDKAVLTSDSVMSPIYTIVWKHGPYLAMEWFRYGDETFSYRQFKDRGSLDTSTGALTITGLTPDDSGSYTVEINDQVTSKTELLVISPVSKPTLSLWCEPEMTYCVLTCNGNTTDAEPVTYRWTSGDKTLSSTKEHKITKENKEPWFSCAFENPVSFNSSEKVFNPFMERNLTWIYILIAVFGVILVVCIIIFLIKKKKDEAAERKWQEHQEMLDKEESPMIPDDLETCRLLMDEQTADPEDEAQS